MIIDLRCPIELTGFEVTRDDAGRSRAYLKLFNLSRSGILSFSAVVRWENELGERDETPLYADRLFMDGRSAITMPASTSLGSSPEPIELHIERVEWAGGREWRAKPGYTAVMPERDALSGAEINALLAHAGSDAVCYAEAIGDNWLCVCGRLNPRKVGRCARCERERDAVLKLYTRGAVPLDGAVPDIEPVRAPFNEGIDMRALFLRQRGRLIRRTVTLACIALIIVLIAAGTARFRQYRERSRDYIPPVKITE